MLSEGRLWLASAGACTEVAPRSGTDFERVPVLVAGGLKPGIFWRRSPGRAWRLGGKRPSLAQKSIRTFAETLATLLKGLAERPVIFKTWNRGRPHLIQLHLKAELGRRYGRFYRVGKQFARQRRRRADR